ncbi:MAG: hypothetical protein WC438_04305 [Candidatus Pacearchaeota archaeon]
MIKRRKQLITVIIGILILLILYTLKNTSYFTRVAGFIFSIVLFYFVDVFFKLNFRTRHYFIFILISASGILLSPSYFIYPNYDKILHLVTPALICILIFFLINRLDIKLDMKLLLTISIVISLLTFFEIGEFTLDKLFDWKLQGVFLRGDMQGLEKLNILMDRNDDTMIDLILGTLSSLMFVLSKTLSYNYKKYAISKKLKIKY